jgi:hypothetical protein
MNYNNDSDGDSVVQIRCQNCSQWVSALDLPLHQARRCNARNQPAAATTTNNNHHANANTYNNNVSWECTACAARNYTPWTTSATCPECETPVSDPPETNYATMDDTSFVWVNDPPENPAAMIASRNPSENPAARYQQQQPIMSTSHANYNNHHSTSESASHSPWDRLSNMARSLVSDCPKRPSVRSSTATPEVIYVPDDDTPANNNINNTTGSTWQCPRCTLVNYGGDSCEACYYEPQRTNPTIPTRSQLFGPSTTLSTNTNEPTIHNNGNAALGGALLGSVLGAAGAIARGRPVGSAALSGAMQGAVTGAILSTTLESPTRRTARNNVSRQRRDTSRQGTSNGHQHQPQSLFDSMALQMMNDNDRDVTRRVQVTRRSDRGRTQDTAFLPDSVMQALFSSDGLYATSNNGNTAQQRRQQPLRHSSIDGMSYEQLLRRFGDGSDHLGASEGQIRSLPVSRCVDSNSGQCAVCMEDFGKGDKRKTLPCWHVRIVIVF